jgi:hypothetical protein
MKLEALSRQQQHAVRALSSVCQVPVEDILGFLSRYEMPVQRPPLSLTLPLDASAPVSSSLAGFEERLAQARDAHKQAEAKELAEGLAAMRREQVASHISMAFPAPISEICGLLVKFGDNESTVRQILFLAREYGRPSSEVALMYEVHGDDSATVDALETQRRDRELVRAIVDELEGHRKNLTDPRAEYRYAVVFLEEKGDYMQTALDACAAAGGGRVVFTDEKGEAGIY